MMSEDATPYTQIVTVIPAPVNTHKSAKQPPSSLRSQTRAAPWLTQPGPEPTVQPDRCPLAHRDSPLKAIPAPPTGPLTTPTTATQDQEPPPPLHLQRPPPSTSRQILRSSVVRPRSSIAATLPHPRQSAQRNQIRKSEP